MTCQKWRSKCLHCTGIERGSGETQLSAHSRRAITKKIIKAASERTRQQTLN